MNKVKHIPERGCHNCRLHCVNHKECASEYPCKQGMEWRPILPIPQLCDQRDDLIQYATNLLYSAFDEGRKNVRISEFDEWVKERIEEIDEYFNSLT